MGRSKKSVAMVAAKSLAVAALAATYATGCASSRHSGPAASAATSDSSELATALTPDGFPNINVVPRGETVPLSNAEKSQLLADLAAAKARQASGDTSPATAAEIARLRQLARRHGIAAIEQIEDN
jgi:hypothetical protein